MKQKLTLALALAGQLAWSPAYAQGSGKNVTVFRMAGPQLGVRLEEVDAEAVTRLKLKEEKGALVTEVLEKSAAEKAGLKKDDVILKFQGESVLTASQLSRLVRDVPAGRKVDLDIVRGGAPLKVTAVIEKGEWSTNGNFETHPDMSEWNERLSEKLGKLNDFHFKTREKGEPQRFSFKMDDNTARAFGPGAFNGNAFDLLTQGRGRLGVSYTEIEGQLASYFKSPKDAAVLVSSVVEGSAADKAGIKAGDLLIKVGGTPVENGSDLHEAVQGLEAGKTAGVVVWRDGRSVELQVTIAEERKRGGALTTRRRPVS
jgi:C-terminal processing protease CtpA/Prc